MEKFNLSTSKQVELIDITDKIQSLVTKRRMKEGVCIIFIPHTTAAITINENADACVRKDIIKTLNKIVPFDDYYSHSEGNSAAHIKASLLGFSETVFVENGCLALGTWQGIYFGEFDGPRTRQVWVKIL